MESPLLNAVVRPGADAAVVDLRGEVIEHTGHVLRSALRKAAESGGPVLVNMHEVESMDSSGLAVLIESANRQGAGALRLFGCNPRIRRLLDITGVDRIVGVYATEEEAAGSAGEAPASPAGGASVL